MRTRSILLLLIVICLIRPTEALLWDFLVNLLCILTFGLLCFDDDTPSTRPTLSPTNGVDPSTSPASSPFAGEVWVPAPRTTWQWQLQGTIDTSFDVTMYDIDLFDSPQATIDKLHADGRIVICYFSAGSFEDFRGDKDDFPADSLGNTLAGFSDELWLDIRNANLKPVMRSRLDLAVSKDCDGVEPDNVDAYQNNSGFPLTSNDQLEYNRWLAKEAHDRGLSIGLKNDLDQVTDLVGDFDWALNEQCFEFDECEVLSSFVAAGKAVFGVEYQGNPAVYCPPINALQFSWLKKEEDLFALPRFDCMQL